MSSASIHSQRIIQGRIFRLLFVHPALDEHQQLECYCLPFEIDAAPAYEALSYVWGPPEPSTELLCNGQSVKIRVKLNNALRKLRLPSSTRIIWTDAICINQEDDEEKSHQVPLMGSIYSLAKRVIVWLGHGDPQQIQEALASIKLIATACRQYDQDHNRSNDDYVRHTMVKLPTDQFSPAVCSSLEQLFGMPWFSRIWCVQEIHLAQDALVLWGKLEISWADLGLAASWIFDKTANADALSLGPDPVTPLLEVIDISRADIVRDKKRYPLLETLQNFREFDASDPRDKVYGLLNLVSLRTEIEGLKVDYSKSVAQVFADTVLCTVQLYSRLSTFAYITHPRDYEGDAKYRSWAPRWDDSNVARVLGVPEADCAWSACGSTMATMTRGTRAVPEQLCLKGIKFERVVEIEEIMDSNLRDPKPTNVSPDIFDHSPGGIDADSQPNEMHPFLKTWEKLVRTYPSHKGKEERNFFLARTLTAGTFGETDTYIQHLDREAYNNYYCAFLRFIRRLSQLHSSGDEGDFHHDANSSQFEMDSYHTCQQRRMFWTENGSLGLGPQCMKVDDIVVVLYGGSTPYVLRPKGDSYLFIGQAYVDDIMYGELVESLASGGLQEQTFVLV